MKSTLKAEPAPVREDIGYRLTLEFFNVSSFSPKEWGARINLVNRTLDIQARQ